MPTRNNKLQNQIPLLFNNISKLYFLENSIWKPLPNWAQFYIHLGVLLGNIESDNSRYIAAISAPSRAFVAPLISSGILISRLIESFGKGSTDEEYVRYIKSLKPGTPIEFITGGRRKKGFIGNHVNTPTGQYIGIKYQKNGELYTEKFIESREAYKIKVLDCGDFNLPKDQKGKQILPPSDFLKSLFRNMDLNCLISGVGVECVLISLINIISFEIKQSIFGFNNEEDKFITGTLQEILKPMGNQFQWSGIAHRSYLLSSESNYSREFSRKTTTYITVFDGANGYLKLRESWQKSNWVVILDRTERNYEYALTQVNNDYSYRTNEKLPIKFPPLPAGIEMMFYEVSK